MGHIYEQRGRFSVSQAVERGAQELRKIVAPKNAAALTAAGVVTLCIFLSAILAMQPGEHPPGPSEVCRVHQGVQAFDDRELVCRDGTEYYATYSGVPEKRTWNRR